jgi:hypothetical protein
MVRRIGHRWRSRSVSALAVVGSHAPPASDERKTGFFSGRLTSAVGADTAMSGGRPQLTQTGPNIGAGWPISTETEPKLAGVAHLARVTKYI